MSERPKILVICGSTRFIEQMAVLAWEHEKAGYITFSPCLLPANYAPDVSHHLAEADGVKQSIDDLYLRKIDLCDEVLVANINGYIGESTRREINYAESLGKPVRYLEPLP